MIFIILQLIILTVNSLQFDSVGLPITPGKTSPARDEVQFDSMGLPMASTEPSSTTDQTPIESSQTSVSPSISPDNGSATSSDTSFVAADSNPLLGPAFSDVAPSKSDTGNTNSGLTTSPNPLNLNGPSNNPNVPLVNSPLSNIPTSNLPQTKPNNAPQTNPGSTDRSSTNTPVTSPPNAAGVAPPGLLAPPNNGEISTDAAFPPIGDFTNSPKLTPVQTGLVFVALFIVLVLAGIGTRKVFLSRRAINNDPENLTIKKQPWGWFKFRKN